VSIFKEPFDRAKYELSYQHKGYENIQKTYIHLHAGKTSLGPANVVISFGVFAFSVGFALLWWPLILVNVLTMIMWILVPQTRLLTQDVHKYLHQNGTTYMGDPDLNGPAINWRKANHPFYQEALADWLDEVRQSKNVSINRAEWSKYFKRVDRLIKKQETMELPPGPNFDKLNALESLLEDK